MAGLPRTPLSRVSPLDSISVFSETQVFSAAHLLSAACFSRWVHVLESVVVSLSMLIWSAQETSLVDFIHQIPDFWGLATVLAVRL